MSVKATHRPKKPKTAVTKRKPTSVRRLEIATVAGDLFAKHGFSVSTRTISDALGITQAALYRHFKSKEELIEEVFRVRYLDEKPSDFNAILEESDDPLANRLTNAYTSFFNNITETSLKLFHRASYDGLEIAKRYSPHLDQRILWPVLRNLREAARLPALESVPNTREERELALMLHSTIVFLAIRKFVYHVDFKGEEPGIIKLYVNAWLAGALHSIKAIKRTD